MYHRSNKEGFPCKMIMTKHHGERDQTCKPLSKCAPTIKQFPCKTIQSRSTMSKGIRHVSLCPCVLHVMLPLLSFLPKLPTPNCIVCSPYCEALKARCIRFARPLSAPCQNSISHKKLCLLGIHQVVLNPAPT